MIETIINNIEAFIVRAIEIILVIAVVLQRTKISRKVKDMEDTLLKSLTVEQLETELKRRKELQLEKLEPEEEDNDRIKFIEKEQLKERLRNIIASIDLQSIYQFITIKKDIEELRKHREEFGYPKRIEMLLNDEMELEKYEE